MIKVRHLRIRYFSLIMVGILLLFALLLASPGMAGSTLTGTDVLQTESPATAVLFLLDESGTINGECGATCPVDKEAKRYEIVRFFMTLMGTYHRQEPEKHDLQIGVAQFAKKYEPVLPFTSSSRLFDNPDWGTYYERLSNTEPGATGEEACKTHFKEALDKASKDLLAQEAGEHILVLITDGRFEEEQERKSKVEETLESFKSQVRVHVILLGQSYVEQNLCDLSASELKLWKEDISTWKAWNRDRLISLPDDADPTCSLVDQPWFHEFLPTVSECERTATVTIPVPPFRRYMRLFLLSDNLVDETWTLEPTIQTEVQKWWLDPPAGEIEASIRSRGEITQTLVYYAYSDEPYPVNLEAQVIPDRQEVGHPVELQAWLTLEGGRLITDTAQFSVQASVEPGETYDLISGADGRFTHTLTETVEGDYRVSFNAVTLPALKLPPIHEVERTLQIGRVPHLEMSTSLSFTSPLSATVVVTVTVENPDAGKRAYTPRLEIVERGETIPLRPCLDARCIDVVQVAADELLTLRASLPKGETGLGIPFSVPPVETQVAIQSIEKTVHVEKPVYREKIVYVEKPVYEEKIVYEERLALWPVWLAIAVGSISLAVAGVLIKSRRPKPHMVTLLGQLSTASDEAIQQALKEFLGRGIKHMPEDIRICGRKISEFYRDKTLSTRRSDDVR